MSVKGKRSIYVGPADGSNDKPLRVEGLATGAVFIPGEVVRQVGAAMSLNTVAGTTRQQFLVADRNTLLQTDVDTAYTVSEQSYAIQPRSGEFINVRVADAQVLVVGTPLARAATGALVAAAVDGTVQIECYSDETVTTSTAAPGQLVRVRAA